MADQSESNKEYINILTINRKFLDYLNINKINLYGWDNVNAIMTTHVSWNKRILWSPTPVTFSKHIINVLKTKIWQQHPLSEWLVISDDLGMEGASDALKSMWIKNTEANKILMSLAAGHDIVLHLENSFFKGDIDDILDEVVKLIDAWVDLNQDWKSDLTVEELKEKAKKTMELMARKWELLSNWKWHYQIKDWTYF